MKGNTKLVGTTVNQIIDHETGQLIDTTVEKHFKTKVDSEEFFVVYLKKLGSLYGLTSATHIKMLIKLCEIADFNTGRVRLTPRERADIMKEFEITSSNVSRAITALKKRGLVSGERGDFYINPELFWKGSEITRREALLKDDGVTFKMTFYSEE